MLFGDVVTLPHPLLQSLPFTDEQLEAICNETDIVDFIECYTIYFGEDEGDLFKAYVNETGLLEKLPRLFPNAQNTAQAVTVGALKHSFAYSRILTGLVGCDCVNAMELPYLLESETDLSCALQLLSKGHYKQTNQTLRSALEAAVIHAHFSSIGVAYDDLCVQTIPPMKDHKRGMLNQLVASRLLSATEAQFMSDLYNDLSAATHSQFKYLEHKFEETFENEIFTLSLQRVRETCIACMTVALNMDQIERLGPVNRSTKQS